VNLLFATLTSTSAAGGPLNDWLRHESPAFSGWDLGGQIRGRYEVFDNGHSFEFPERDFQKSGADNDNSYFLLRELLHVGHTPFPWLATYAEVRDSNSVGDDHSRNPGADSFDLQQAYLLVGNPELFPLSLKVGRQALIYGDERLIGAADWSNVPRSFDAALVRFENHQVRVDSFASRVVRQEDGSFNEPDYQDWFTGIYISTQTLLPWQETQFYVLSRNSSAGAAVTPRDIYSIGFRLKSLPGKLAGWDYAVETIAQRGSLNQGGVRLEQAACATSVAGGYSWKDTPGTPRLSVEYCYSTGDSDPQDGTSETLDNLFPTNHKFYGNMDFEGWRNLHNPRAVFSLKPVKSVSLILDYQLYWLADTHDLFYPPAGAGRNGNGYGRNPLFSSFAGSELNLNAAYEPLPWLAFRAGYGHFFTGSYVNSSKAAVGGATDADWFYCQTTVGF
jgi:hypothetical protein